MLEFIKSNLLKTFGKYKFERSNLISSYKIGTAYVCFVIIVWVSLGCLVIYNDGHVKINDQYLSTLGFSIKGTVITNYSKEDFNSFITHSEMSYYNRVWDYADIFFKLSDEFHIMTNVVITPNQTMGKCPEHPNLKGFLCENDSNCTKGTLSSHGITTGKCVKADSPYYEDGHFHFNISTCEIDGWCPVDRGFLPLNDSYPLLIDTKNVTIWLSNSINFNHLNVTINNMFESNVDYYIDCRFDPQHNPFCPVFLMEDIVKYTNCGLTYEEMAKNGGVILMSIEWDCWLSTISECRPKYSFQRIDEEKYPTGKPTYRYAHYYYGERKRTFFRAFRIRISVKVIAKVKQYNHLTFFHHMVSWYGLFHSLVLVFTGIVAYKYCNGNQYHEIYITKANTETTPLLNDNSITQHTQKRRHCLTL